MRRTYLLVTAILGAVPLARGAVGTLADSIGMAAWGDNYLGHATPLPGTGYTAISAGLVHNLALKSDGSLAGWGWNGYGQTAVPAGTNYTAIAAGGYHSLALKSDGSLAGWGWNNYGQTTVPAGTYAAIAAGVYHSLALKSDGSLAGWGWNNYGQTTVPAGAYTAIAADGYHSLAVRSDGTLAGWGRNDYGQATVPAGDNYVAVSAGFLYSLALKSDGSLVAWGSGATGQTYVPAGSHTAVSAGSYTALALRADGSLVAWGAYNYGQLNVPTGTFVAVECGETQALALRAREQYDGDLLVNGHAMGVKAQLNRSITVAGNATVNSTTMTLHNTPTAAIAGSLNLNTGIVNGSGFIDVTGPLVLSGANQIRNGADVVASMLQGTGSLTVTNAKLAVGANRLHIGPLTMNNSLLELRGTGDFSVGNFTADNSDIRIVSGQRMILRGTGDTNLTGNSITVHGNSAAVAELQADRYVLQTGGMISARDAILRFPQTTIGYEILGGSLAVTGGRVDLYGDVLSNGTIAVTGGAVATFYDDVEQYSTLNVSKAGSLASTAIFLGSFAGYGAAGGGNIFLEGDLRPGHSPGAINFAADVSMGPNLLTVIEIAGTDPGSQYDQVLVNGTLSAGGTLELQLLDGFVPAKGDSFQVISATSLSGAFSEIVLPALPDGMIWMENQSSTGLTLTAVPEPGIAALLLIASGPVTLRRRRLN